VRADRHVQGTKVGLRVGSKSSTTTTPLRLPSEAEALAGAGIPRRDTNRHTVRTRMKNGLFMRNLSDGRPVSGRCGCEVVDDHPILGEADF
jgi:hypothetical protein